MVQDLQPVPRRALATRVALAMAGGGAVTLALVAALLGFRPDFAAAVHGPAIWIKWAYTLSLTVAAVVMAARVARPEPVCARLFWLPVLPVAALAAIGAAELATAPRGSWRTLWLGQTWSVCPLLVLMLTVPIFLGLLWAFRRFAPTRLRLAGAAAGLVSGAWAATLYSLHCTEASPLFVLTWYSLGIALPAAAGAALGPRLLRW